MTKSRCIAFIESLKIRYLVGGVMTPPYKSTETAIDERPKIGYDILWSDMYETIMPHLR